MNLAVTAKFYCFSPLTAVLYIRPVKNSQKQKIKPLNFLGQFLIKLSYLSYNINQLNTAKL